MIQKDAIQELVSTGNAPLFLKQLEEAKTKSSLIALPHDYVLQNMEKFNEFRDDLRGKFETSLIAEFVKYAKIYAAGGSAAFVDVDSMTAVAIFDIGTVEQPLHQRHKSSCALKKTAPFKILLNVNGDRFDQRGLAEWLEDYAEYITPYGDDGEPIENKKAVEAIRTLKFEHTRGSEREVQNFAASQSEYEKVATMTKESLVIPAGFRFDCIPYQGLESRTFDMRLSIIKNEILSIRIKRLEETQEKIAVEFKDKLLAALAEAKIEMPTYIGEF